MEELEAYSEGDSGGDEDVVEEELSERISELPGRVGNMGSCSRLLGEVVAAAEGGGNMGKPRGLPSVPGLVLDVVSETSQCFKA